MDKHIVIIGSGLGGLTCGYILAKNGYKVTILEKNAQFGGCLQTFTRNGVKFETGMHYIGSVEKGQALYNLFNYLSLFPNVKLSSLDKSAYDIISIAGQRYPFANGTENFIDSLARFFPKERKNIENYCLTIKDVANNSPLYSQRFTNSVTLINPTYIKESASGFIENSINDLTLREVLAGNVPLYAGIRNKTPLYIHALINDFYNNSAYRIIGGSGTIARTLVKSIRALGGTVRALSEVTAINCNDKEAKSVTLRGGELILTDYIISNIHPVRTIEMLETRLIRNIYRQRVMSLNNTVSNFTVYIRFKKDKVPYLNSNFFHFNKTSVWECENYADSNWPLNFLYMHLCSEQEQKYADGAILIAYMNFIDVAKWKGTLVDNRGEEYENFKLQKAWKLLDELEKQLPGTKENIEEFYTSTPLTYLDYTGTVDGSMYGIIRDCNEPIQTIISQRTKIPNLYQAGQNINSHGILGVIIGAIITSGEFIGVNDIIQQIKDSSV